MSKTLLDQEAGFVSAAGKAIYLSMFSVPPVLHKFVFAGIQSSVDIYAFSNLNESTHCPSDCPKWSKGAFSDIPQIPTETQLQFSINQKNQSHFIVLVRWSWGIWLLFAASRGLHFRKWSKNWTSEGDCGGKISGFWRKTVQCECWRQPTTMELIKNLLSVVKLLTPVVEILPLPCDWSLHSICWSCEKNLKKLQISQLYGSLDRGTAEAYY